LSACTGDDGWDTSAIGVTAVLFQSAAPFVRVLMGKIRVDADVDTIIVGARCTFAAANTGDVRFTIGAGTATISYTAANNGLEQTSTIATSSTGTGLLTWTIEIDQTAGAGTSNQLRNVRIEAQQITSGLPDPEEEYTMTPRQESVTTQNITGTDTAISDTLDNTPVSGVSVVLFLNGQQMRQGATYDYTISGTTITWLASSGTAPDLTTGDTLIAYYMS
jgi:hypothetical protein